MRAYSLSHIAVPSLLLAGLILFALAAPVSAFTISLSSDHFETATTIYSEVSTFSLDIEMDGDLEAGRVYDNGSVISVEYSVNGRLASGTPSNFPAFALNRTPAGEGAISAAEWISQGSSIFFAVAETANLLDGLQVSDLVANHLGWALKVDAREFERQDVSRYHPPFLILRANGGLLLQSSNNSSGNSGTINPQTRESVDLNYGDEYKTLFSSGPNAEPITIAPPVPEPGTALLLGLGLAGLASVRRRRSFLREFGLDRSTVRSLDAWTLGLRLARSDGRHPR